MNRKEILNCENAPQWIKDGIWEGEVNISNSGYVTFIHGTWKYGIWENGTWKYGIWENGIWENGTWKDGIWENGTWKDGTWENGTWEDGIWKDGTWKDGIWEYGTWEHGTWKDGYKRVGLCKWDVFYNTNSKRIRIGCKGKSVQEWKEWFASNKQYETERDTKQFKQIYISFQLAEKAIELESELENV